MSAEARHVLLDITRLVGRAGRGPLTGIDRVERAYLAALVNREGPFMLICRSPLGHLLFRADVAPRLLAWIDVPEAKPASLLAALRPLAFARPSRSGLARVLVAHAAGGGNYLNVGHANLDAAFLAVLRQVPGLGVTVMIHDTIPLDHPEYSGDRAPAEFAAKLGAVAAHADLVLCPSSPVKAGLERWCAGFARTPTIRVAPLGVAPAPPEPKAIPAWIETDRPYFVTLGTIEPRKNHALLLDIWDGFRMRLPTGQIPRLFILGRRGWKNADVFARLDECARIGGDIVERAGLPDAAAMALLVGARALLAPSRAEGFGLPAAEAAALGVPVLATDLAVTREILGAYPVYLPTADRYAWSVAIETLIGRAAKAAPDPQPLALAGWAEHFRLVFTMI